MWSDTKIIPSAEGNVAKYVFTKADAVAEAVLYRYPDFTTRTVICCSSQSGCPVGCRFCGAGDSFVRSLTGDEIVAQAQRCVTDTGVDPASMGRLQIMFMSMGEPMLNPRGMGEALRRLHALYPGAALLISTIGPLVDYEWLVALSQHIPTIGLQFSVHEPTDEARDVLIPFRGKLTLEEIALTGELWAKETGRRPFFNYCAADHNTGADDADKLAARFKPEIWNATISVICERNEGMPARNAHQVELAREFSEKLVARGYNTRVFDPAGQDDIGGGCGQLWFVQDWMHRHAGLARPSCGRGKPVVHVPQPVPEAAE